MVLLWSKLKGIIKNKWMKELLPGSNMGNTPVCIGVISNDVIGVPVMSSIGETPLDT